MTYTSASIRELEGASIREFVESCSDHFIGRVLDLGCGRQPYRDVIEQAGGSYVGFDRVRFPANVSGEDVGAEITLADAGSFDAVLVNQVIQYVEYPGRWLATEVVSLLAAGGVLVMTYPLSWTWIETTTDRWRFTPLGMGQLLLEAGFVVERSEERAAVELGGFRFPLGYGVVARAT